jgi:hypothetical protein
LLRTRKTPTSRRRGRGTGKAAEEEREVGVSSSHKGISAFTAKLDAENGREIRRREASER